MIADCGLRIADRAIADCGLRIADCTEATRSSEFFPRRQRKRHEVPEEPSGNPQSAIRNPQSVCVA